MAGTSYAGIANSNRMKWVQCFLYRENETIPYTLTQYELADLLFNRLKFKEGDIESVDTQSMRQIKIEVKSSLDIEKHALTSQTEIREVKKLGQKGL